MGHDLCCHLTINLYCYGSIFPLVRSVLGREIQELSFDVWYSVEIICELKVVICVFGGRVKIHVTVFLLDKVND